MSSYESKLASQCQEIAHCLSYNGDKNESAAKHILLEASRVLDSHAVKVTRFHIRNARGKSRMLTLRERLAIWLLGGKTEVRP